MKSRIARPVEGPGAPGPMPAMMRPDGYEDRTLLPSQQASGSHDEDCPCAACETHRTFHSLLRGSEPVRPARSKVSKPVRRPPANWDSSEGAPLSENGPKPPLRLMKWKGNPANPAEEEAPKVRPAMPPRPTEGTSRCRRPRQKSDWNSDVAQPLDTEVPSSAPDVMQDRTARMDRTRPRPARAASADFKDIPAAAGPPRRGGSVPKRFEAVSEQPPPRPSSRPGSTESQEQGRGCPRCGRQLAGRALVMHLKSCGITRSRGDPFAPSDQEERRGQSTGPTMEARSPPLPARKAREVPVARAKSPPVPAQVSRAKSPPVPAAAQRSESPPLPARASAGQSAAEPFIPPFADEGPMEPMMPCPHCQRSFRQSALERHIGICQKVFQEKRKVFNAVKNAMPDEAIKAKKAQERQEKQERRAGAGARRNPEEQPLKGGGMPSWKKQSEAFRQAIKQARMVDQCVKEGKPLSSLPAPPPTDPALDDRVACPHCGRRFGQSQADRHIPFCASRTAKQRNHKR